MKPPLTLQELRAVSDQELTAEVNRYLVPPYGDDLNKQMAVNREAAQFYIAELNRREDQRAQAERDRIESERHQINLRLDLLIVGLIVVEIIVAIGLAIWGDRRQTEDVNQQLAAFKGIQKALF
jgi:hypothetical protein